MTQIATIPKASVAAQLYDIDLKRIKESLTNPRKLFDPKPLAELADSIKKSGLVHAVLLRPIKDATKDYELVVGARRFRASAIAEAKSIRAEIRELSDQQVIEIQTIENLHRADVHPLEEAEGFHMLMAPPFKKSADEIAALIGKSKGYIYGALKLLTLTEKSRKAFFGGKLDKSVAILLARIPNAALQEKALDEVTKVDGYSGSAFSFKKAAAHIQERYMLRLAGAAFDPKDEKLTKAGACGPCPKRTGNQRELFGDVESADVCTDPACFREKVDAAAAAKLIEAEKAGKAVVPEKNIKKLFHWGTDSIDSQSGYAKLSDKPWQDEKGRTIGAILKKSGSPAQVFVAQAPSGALVELVKQSDADAAMKKAGVRLNRASSASGSAAVDKKRRREQLRQRAITRATIAAVVAAVRPGAAFFKIIIRCLGRHSWADTLKEVEVRRGLDSKGSGKRGSALLKLAEGMAEKDLGPLLLEIAITQGAFFSYRSGVGEGVKEAADAYGVDIKKIEKAIASAEGVQKTMTKHNAKAKKGGSK